MILLTLVTIAVFLICVHLLLNYNAKARIIRKMPGPADLFIVGNMFTYIASPRTYILPYYCAEKLKNIMNEKLIESSFVF